MRRKKMKMYEFSSAELIQQMNKAEKHHSLVCDLLLVVLAILFAIFIYLGAAL